MSVMTLCRPKSYIKASEIVSNKINVVFISPHFPLYFHNFCSRLKEKGVNVLGVGDSDYNSIPADTKSSLTEYYKVGNLENFGGSP